MENGVHGIIYTQINKLKQEQRGWILYSVCLVNKEALSEILVKSVESYITITDCYVTLTVRF